MSGRLLVLAGLFALAVADAAAQGFAGLGREADGYAAVTPGRAFSFPQDHGPHDGYRIEWWYLTANLQGPDGAPYGVQWTLFRSALAPPKAAPETDNPWASPYLFMGHAGLTTPDKHFSAELFARGRVGQAGVEAEPFRAYIDDWRFDGVLDGALSGEGDATVTASGEGFSYRLTLKPEGPLVLQGEGGFSRKAPMVPGEEEEGARASYYYSQPFFSVDGVITVAGEEIAVTGQAWMDREWSSRLLAETQEGWDWFSLHLRTGAKVMLFRLRDKTNGDYYAGTWISPDGRAEPLGPDAIAFRPLDRARVAGARLPVRWRLEVPSKALDVTARAVNPKSFMATSFPYWEGPVRLSGSHDGVGYLEMTGY